MSCTADKELRDEIFRNARTSPEAFTQAESEALDEMFEKSKSGELSEIAAMSEKQQREFESAAEVYQSKVQELEQAGRDTESAKKDASLIAKMYTSLARTYNKLRGTDILPKEYARLYPITVSRSEDGSVGLYFQDERENVSAEMENEYNAAVEKGDMEGAQKIVNAAAGAVGYDTSGKIENGYFVGNKDRSYRGYKGRKSPVSKWGHMMFVDNPDKAYWSKNSSKIQDELYSVPISELTNFNDLREEIMQKFEEDRENGALYNYFDLDDVDNMTKEQFADQFNPSDIVDSAAGWDNSNYLQWFWDRIGKASNLKGIKTSDGAIVFAGNNIVQRVANNDTVVSDNTGNVVPLSQRFNDKKNETYYQDGIKIDENAVTAVQSTNGKSVNDFTSEDIKKTEMWTRKFWNELGVKSPFFRAWFGDWRANDNATTLPVITITGTKADMKRDVIHNNDTSWDINASSQVYRETPAQNRASVFAADALGNIEEIINNSILLDSVSAKEFVDDPSKKRNRNRKKDTAFLHSFYSLVRYRHDIFLCKLFVEEKYNREANGTIRRAYVLKDIKKSPLPNANRFHQNKSGSNALVPGDSVSVSDLFRIVKQYDTNFKPKESSLAVGKDGKPLVVKHSTFDNTFSIFDSTKAGENTIGNANDFGAAASSLLGFWFNSQKQNLPGFAKSLDLYLDIKNPYYADSVEELWDELNNRRGEDNADFEITRDEAKQVADDFVKSLKEQGYDGIIIKNDNEFGGSSYVIFSSTQAKSATANRGTFDITNPNIYYQKAVNALKNNKLFQAVFHASPHRFQKFMLDHIGTGEGAQAYGWGLYFAGKKAVADWYRKAFNIRNKDTFLLDGKEWGDYEDTDKNGLSILTDLKFATFYNKHDLGQAIAWALNDYADKIETARDRRKSIEKTHIRVEEQKKKATIWRESDEDEYAFACQLYESEIKSQNEIEQKNQEKLDWLKANKDKITKLDNDAQLYKADIPDEHDGNYLLWDEKVTKQTAEKIFNLLKDSGIKMPVEVTFDGKSAEVLSKTMLAEKDKSSGETAAYYHCIGWCLHGIWENFNNGVKFDEAIQRQIKYYEDQITAERNRLEENKGTYTKVSVQGVQKDIDGCTKAVAWLKENREKFKVTDVVADSVTSLGTNGERFYKELSVLLGSDKAASELLNEAGIVGIKYLDGSSRNSGEGSYNYVIFDANAIQMLDTYYQAFGQRARGSIEFPAVAGYGQPARINLSPKDDFSTVAHEMAHFYLWNLGQISQYGNISDLSVISKWWGESSGDIIGWMNGKGKELFSAELLKGLSGDSFAAWLADPSSVSGELAAAYGTATQEYFARGFETYLPNLTL